MSKKVLAVFLATIMLLSFAACSKDEASPKKQVWCLGGGGLLSDEDVETCFDDVKETIDAESIYAEHEITADMLEGAYTLNNKEKDLKKVRKDIPFEDVKFKDNSVANLTVVPTAVYFGKDNVSCSDTRYNYTEFEAITDKPIAVIELATKDDIGQTPCVYEINGNKITFKQIEKTSKDDAPFTYDYTGVEFTYDFKVAGPYITFSKGGTSLKLISHCFSENTNFDLAVSGYSLPDSPLVDDLDCFYLGTFNYGFKRNGKSYDFAAIKLVDDGKAIIYLKDKDYSTGEETTVIEEFAYIAQSPAGAYSMAFNIVLFDEEKVYYYTDDITSREERILTEQGIDINDLSEEELKELAEKKSDLYDDLYEEFQKQGINVTINRSNGEISMDSSVLFGGDSSVISDDGKVLLNKFLNAYTSIIFSEKYEGFIAKTMVEGHTAPVAGDTYEDGFPLSIERANNVKDYCVSSETGVDTSKLAANMEAVGYSNGKPITDSDGNVDMVASRRVSFRFVVDLSAI